MVFCFESLCASIPSGEAVRCSRARGVCRADVTISKSIKTSLTSIIQRILLVCLEFVLPRYRRGKQSATAARVQSVEQTLLIVLVLEVVLLVLQNWYY